MASAGARPAAVGARAGRRLAASPAASAPLVAPAALEQYDPVPQVPLAPVMAVPLAALLAAMSACVLTAAVTIATTSWGAARADVAELLRRR